MSPKSASVGRYNIPEVGNDKYDHDAKMLTEFFKEEVSQFIEDELDPIGKKIIQLLLKDTLVQEYKGLL